MTIGKFCLWNLVLFVSCIMWPCTKEEEGLHVSITKPIENGNLEHFANIPIEYE